MSDACPRLNTTTRTRLLRESAQRTSTTRSATTGSWPRAEGLGGAGAPTAAAGLGFVAAALQLHYAFAALGRCLGALAPSDSVANAAASLVLLFNLLLCGFFADPDDLPAAWRRVARALPAASGYEALVVHEFSGIPELYLTSKVGAQKYRSAPLAGDAVLRCFGFDPAAAPAAHLRLFLFAVAYECLTCFVFFWFGFESR